MNYHPNNERNFARFLVGGAQNSADPRLLKCCNMRTTITTLLLFVGLSAFSQTNKHIYRINKLQTQEASKISEALKNSGADVTYMCIPAGFIVFEAEPTRTNFHGVIQKIVGAERIERTRNVSIESVEAACASKRTPQ